MADRDAWRGRLDGRTDPDVTLEVVMPLNQYHGSGSGVFPARASDGERWWVKPLNNIQGSPMISVDEYIVGRVGQAISAPVCEVAVIKIREEHRGWEFRPGAALEPGLSYACREIPDAQEVKGTLSHRALDENRRRHVGIYALWDLCWGSDPQWLHQTTDDERIFSHDHGLYFPNGQGWAEDALTQHVDDPHPWPEDPRDLDPGAIDDVAQRVADLSLAALVPILLSVPAVWPVQNEALEALGWFLEGRANPVADRLRSMKPATP
jgi:hypothetical protein